MQVQNSMPLFSMRFNELCQHFEKHVGLRVPERTGKIIGTRPLLADTVNGEIMGWIANNGFPFLYSYQRLWFSMDGEQWISYDYEVKSGMITFFEMK